jgi:hypothetical protein
MTPCTKFGWQRTELRLPVLPLLARLTPRLPLKSRNQTDKWVFARAVFAYPGL